LDYYYYNSSLAELRVLACVDLLSTTYSASVLATGFGAHIALHILRTEVEGQENKLTEEKALGLLEKCMRVLFYRDARSFNKVFIVSFLRCGLSIAYALLLVSSGDS
jgi:20S proteasome subunit beta 7